MRKGRVAAVTVTLIAVLAIGIAGAWAVIIEAGTMVLRIEGGVTPKALPKHGLAPVTLHGSGALKTIDGSHPPALRAASIDADRDLVVSVKGLPTCKIGQLQAVETKRAEVVCGDAIVGRGSATVEVAFPEQPPFRSTGPLVIFNAGERNGAVTLIGHAYVSVPAPTAVVGTAKITRVNKGPYGLHTEIEVPPIAGGAGSVVAAKIKLGRNYTYKGKRRSVFSGSCSNGRIEGRGTFKYADRTSLSGGIVTPCTATD
ncbi:MAG TPA: hypothetical protein VFY75_01630 [Solirubrobacterales bacterium]|nr:hypothetical protein [Solirubrobacterales bacterium]